MTEHNLTMVIDHTSDLPEYPIPKGERLESHSFFLFHYQRWLESDLFTMGTWEVQGVALALWCKAQNQDPVGTLPQSPRHIAARLGMKIEEWERLMRFDPNPLHNWTPCTVGDEIRLMHPVVTEVALAAYEGHVKGDDRKEADKDRTRMKRLKDSVQKLSGERFANNEMYLAQLDAWLINEFPSGNRTVQRLLRGMEALGTRDLRR